MTTTINASPTNGLVQTADGSGVLKVQSNGKTTNALAWVNFNGTGTVAIRSSYNVSSITDNGTGDYTLNFTTATTDANYAIAGSCQVNLSPTASGWQTLYNMAAPTTSSCRIGTGSSASGTDCAWVNVTIHGN